MTAVDEYGQTAKQFSPLGGTFQYQVLPQHGPCPTCGKCRCCSGGLGYTLTTTTPHPSFASGLQQNQSR